MFDCVIKVNLKTPGVTVETEEQYKTKVGMVKTDLIFVKTITGLSGLPLP